MLRTLRIALINDPLAALIIAIMGSTAVLVSLLESESRVQHRLVGFWGRLLLWVSGGKVDTAGLERIPRHEAFVIVSNHLSMMDIPVLMSFLPIPFRFLAKRSLFRLPFIGWHLHRGGHIRLDREDKRSAVKALAQARRVLQRGFSVLVFAEGSRSQSGLQPFKTGAAHLAIKAGVPILPIGLVGTDRLLPKGSIHIRPGRAHLRVGEPLSPAGPLAADVGLLTERMQAAVAELITAGAGAE